MGAIVGGLYSAGMPIDDLERRFRDASLMKSFMTVPIQLRIAVAPIMFIPRLFGSKAYDGLYKGNKFRKYLLNSVPASEHDISELKIPFKAVVLNVVDGRVYALDKGNLGYALQASSAVPALRKPVQIGNQLFVDGGTAENVPVDEALKTGADIIIAVNVDEDFNELPLEAFRKPGSMGKRMLTWDLWDNDSKLCAKANVTIKPQVTGIGLISRSKKEGIQALEAGEAAAQAKIPEIKKCLAEHGLSI
jgi:NTE family protein